MNRTDNMKALQSNYDKNMCALEKFYPELFKRVMNHESTNQYRIVSTDQSLIYNVFCNQFNEYYYDSKTNLHSVKVEIDGLNLKNTKLALLLGLGLGYEAIYYIQSLADVQKTENIIVVESELELFYTALYTTDLVPLIEHNWVTLLIGLSTEELFVQFAKIFENTRFLKNIKAFNPVYLSSAMKMNREYYMTALRMFKEASLRAFKLVGNSPEDSMIGIRNMFANLPYIINNPGVNMLYGKFDDVTAIVVSSGPSLTKHIEKLKHLYDKALIVCAESTYGILMAHGIKPHIVCALERPERSEYYWNNYDVKDVEEVYLAGCPVIPNELYRSHKGKHLVVYRAFDHFKWLDVDKGMLPINQSAGNMAFSIAKSLGCKNIILLGQDLAFDNITHQTHADGYGHIVTDALFTGDEVLEVDSNNGGTVLTSKTWLDCLKSYEVEVAHYNGRCINTALDGAKITGMEVMPFDEAVKGLSNKNVFVLDLMSELLLSFNKSKPVKEYKAILDKIQIAINDIDVISDLCHKGIDFIDLHETELAKYMNAESLSKNERHIVTGIYNDILQYKSGVQHNSDTFQLLVMHVVQPYYIMLEIDINEVPSYYDIYESAVAQMAIMQKQWFSIINNLSLMIQEDLLHAKECVETLIEEYSKSEEC